MNNILLLLISILFAAFCSGMGIAFLSSNKLRIELNKKQGKFPSGIIAIFTHNPGKFLSIMRLGNLIALVVFGYAFISVFNQAISQHIASGFLVTMIEIISAAVLIILIAEFLPRIFFGIRPNLVLNIFAVPVYIIYILLYPLGWLIIGIANLSLGIISKNTSKVDEEIIFNKISFDNIPGHILLPDKQTQDADHEIKIFRNVLDFTNVKIRDCMIPRTDIVAVEEDASIAELKQKFIDTGVSKIIVYREDIDNIIGYIHSKELFKNPDSIKSKINTLTYVPETMAGNRLMQMFMQEHKSIAIVVDEYGGTSGLLTLEDLIEEIFGDIEDEHDKDNLIERQINEYEFLFSGRIEIEHINETYHLNIPEKDDYDTLAGFILYHHLNLPLAGEMIHIEPFTFIIRKISNTRIDLIQMNINKK